MQDLLIQDGSKRDVGASDVGRVDEANVESGGDDELLSPEERPEVAVEVVLLLPCLAAGCRPQINGVGGDAHVEQA